MASTRTPISPWFRIIRAPNLLTVPGDPLAGILMAISTAATVPDSLHNVFYVIAATLVFYIVGVVVNDIVDVPVDHRERPERPLVQKQIAFRSALKLSIISALGGLGLIVMAGLQSLFTGGLLLASVLSYNLLLKDTYLAGALTMGMCRGISFLLGASIVGFSVSVLVVAGGIAGYVATVTAFAREENKAGPVQKAYTLLAWPISVFLFVILLKPEFLSWHSLPPAILALSCTLLFIAVTAKKLAGASVTPAEKKEAIGTLLRTLLFWQATYVLLSGLPWVWLPGLLLMSLYPIHTIISRKYSAT